MTYYSRKDWKIEPHDVEGSLQDLAESNPILAKTLGPELQELPDGDLDVDAIEWHDTSGLRWLK